MDRNNSSAAIDASLLRVPAPTEVSLLRVTVPDLQAQSVPLREPQALRAPQSNMFNYDKPAERTRPRELQVPRVSRYSRDQRARGSNVNKINPPRPCSADYVPARRTRSEAPVPISQQTLGQALSGACKVKKSYGSARCCFACPLFHLVMPYELSDRPHPSHIEDWTRRVSLARPVSSATYIQTSHPDSLLNPGGDIMYYIVPLSSQPEIHI